MSAQPSAGPGRRRGVFVLGLVLLMQGPAALTTLHGRAVLLALVLPVLYLVDRALAASWCSSDRRVRAVATSTLVLFAAQEAYSGIGVALVNRHQQTVQVQSAGQILVQHLAALGLAALVAIVVCGVRAVRGYVRAVVRLVAPVAGAIVRRPRVVAAARVAPRALWIVVGHHGRRAPPRLALPC